MFTTLTVTQFTIEVHCKPPWLFRLRRPAVLFELAAGAPEGEDQGQGTMPGSVNGIQLGIGGALQGTTSRTKPDEEQKVEVEIKNCMTVMPFLHNMFPKKLNTYFASKQYSNINQSGATCYVVLY